MPELSYLRNGRAFFQSRADDIPAREFDQECQNALYAVVFSKIAEKIETAGSIDEGHTSHIV
ncbi:MAG: hypothetical protein M0Z29_03825 [Actinomycetota bacterium]|nr:hypothetical protein [Actinomycetota bacterium]